MLLLMNYSNIALMAISRLIFARMLFVFIVAHLLTCVSCFALSFSSACIVSAICPAFDASVCAVFVIIGILKCRKELWKCGGNVNI
jgi:hypothetical protein